MRMGGHFTDVRGRGAFRSGAEGIVGLGIRNDRDGEGEGGDGEVDDVNGVVGAGGPVMNGGCRPPSKGETVGVARFTLGWTSPLFGC